MNIPPHEPQGRGEEALAKVSSPKQTPVLSERPGNEDRDLQTIEAKKKRRKAKLKPMHEPLKFDKASAVFAVDPKMFDEKNPPFITVVVAKDENAARSLGGYPIVLATKKKSAKAETHLTEVGLLKMKKGKYALVKVPNHITHNDLLKMVESFFRKTATVKSTGPGDND